LTILFLFLALVFTVALATAIGPTQISLPKIIGIIAEKIPFLNSLVSNGSSDIEETIVLQIRLPRVISAALVGAALAIAGVVLQGLLRNPMADPYVLGLSAGSALGASIAIGFGIRFTLGIIDSIHLMAFIGALATVFVVYNIARTGPRVSMFTLLLAGIALTSFQLAIISSIMIIKAETVHALLRWIFGSFITSDWNNVKIAMPFIIGGSIVIYIFARQLNVMQLGEEQAQQLGVDVERMKKIMLVLSSLITASAVAVSGIIGFIGLIIPHMARILVGPDHRILIPSSALAGAIILVLCDILARTVIEPAELPVGVFTSLLGVPFFLYLLRKKRGLAE